MNMIVWSPKTGGTTNRQFRSDKAAQDFLKEAQRQSFDGSAYLVRVRQGKVLAQVWRQGFKAWEHLNRRSPFGEMKVIRHTR